MRCPFTYSRRKQVMVSSGMPGFGTTKPGDTPWLALPVFMPKERKNESEKQN